MLYTYKGYTSSILQYIMWFSPGKLKERGWSQRPCRNIVQLTPIIQPVEAQNAVPPERPVPIDLTVPYTSLCHKDTNDIAFEYAMRVRSAWEEGLKVVLRLNAPKGGGKSALVSQIMELLSCTEGNYGSISFQRVAQYTINHDGRVRHILHMDPNMTGTRHMHTLHGCLSEYDLVMMENSDDGAYAFHNRGLKTSPNLFVVVRIDIAVDKDVGTTRVFTTTSTSLVPAPPSISHIWTGALLKKEYAPDTRVSQEVIKQLIKLKEEGKLCGLGYETSCDDACAAIYENNVEVWRMTITVEQQGQDVGKGGIDPLKTANAHKDALKVLQAKMDECLREKGLTPHYIAVTKGPGLALTLVEGIYHAQKMAHTLGIPIIHCDHIMGHAITPMMDNPHLNYPYVCQIVSGGHTLTMLVKSATDMVKICWSKSDAWGEILDKIARALGRPEIPAGPAMEKLMNLFMGGNKEWSNVLPTTTDAELEMVLEYPANVQLTVRGQLMEYRRILKEVYGKNTLSASLDPSQVKLVLTNLVTLQKLDGCNKEALIVEFIRAFFPKVPTEKEELNKLKRDIVKMINSVKWTTRSDTIMKAFDTTQESLLYQNQIERYRQHLETKENQTPIFKDFIDLTMTETVLPEPVQSVYSAVLHTVIANSLIKDAMTVHEQYKDVTNYSLTGGVGCNRYIADVIAKALAKEGITFQTVKPHNCSDNAAMIAELAYRVLTEAIKALPSLSPLSELIDNLFKNGMGMIATEPTLQTVEHNATRRWSGPTVAA
jgi:tRNA A37 threonylcarbamoyltransferase TsaD